MSETLSTLLDQITKAYKRKDALYFEGKTITYRELNEQANKSANALAGLGITKGDRVAMMLPNIPEFIYCFFGIQKLGAVAVPFNSMYKGREITYILNDCGARAIITLSNFANLINEIREDVPSLEHVVLTGQRTLIFVTPESSLNVQLVVEKQTFTKPEDAFREVGALLVELLASFGVHEAWYKHRGGVRVGGRKIATILVSEIENLITVNAMLFLAPLDTKELFKVVWVTPEVKDKVLEPSTSIEELTGKRPDNGEVVSRLVELVKEHFGVDVVSGQMKRDELFGYEKVLSLAGR